MNRGKKCGGWGEKLVESAEFCDSMRGGTICGGGGLSSWKGGCEENGEEPSGRKKLLITKLHQKKKKEEEGGEIHQIAQPRLERGAGNAIWGKKKAPKVSIFLHKKSQTEAQKIIFWRKKKSTKKPQSIKWINSL